MIEREELSGVEDGRATGRKKLFAGRDITKSFLTKPKGNLLQ